MTNERFIILKDEEEPEDKTCWCIRDTQHKIKDIYGHYKYDNIEEICEELNRLQNENQQLKQNIYDIYENLKNGTIEVI